MKLVIFGATGNIGRPLTEQALSAGHTVTAFVRSPEKMTVPHDNLRLVKGDIRDAESVANVVAGQDAVLVAVGPDSTRKVILFSQSAAALLPAMMAHNVRRLVFLTSDGVTDEAAPGAWFYRVFVKPIFLRDVYADMRRAEALIMQSDVDWVLARPTQFVAGARTGQYRTSINKYPTPPIHTISHADVADFMLKAAHDPRYSRTAVFCGY